MQQPGQTRGRVSGYRHAPPVLETEDRTLAGCVERDSNRDPDEDGAYYERDPGFPSELFPAKGSAYTNPHSPIMRFGSTATAERWPETHQRLPCDSEVVSALTRSPGLLRSGLAGCTICRWSEDVSARDAPAAVPRQRLRAVARHVDDGVGVVAPCPRSNLLHRRIRSRNVPNCRRARPGQGPLLADALALSAANLASYGRLAYRGAARRAQLYTPPGRQALPAVDSRVWPRTNSRRSTPVLRS
mmetsp:Transcript_37127/g.92401  ORF Transcript_37127/g.92401 Transcript_37127/m.92401 type:complete len:244 (+) Transcript_37127:973-1704(+)